MTTGRRPLLHRLVPTGLPGRFWVLFAGMLVNALGTFVLPYLAIYLGRSGMTSQAVGAVVACFGAGSVVSAVVGGVLADRWGRRQTITVSFATMTLATALLTVITSAAGIAVVVVLLGLFSGLYRPAVQALIADLVPEDDRVRAFGLLYWAGNIGFSVAALCGGYIADRSFTALFLVDAVTCLLGGTVLWLGLRTMPDRHSGAEGRTGAHATQPAPRPTPLFLAFLGLTLLFCVIQTQPWTAVPLVATARGITPAEWGAITAVNGITVVVMQLPVARLIKPWRLASPLAVASLLVAVGFTMVAWISGLGLFMLHTAVWSLGEVFYFAAAPALATRMAPAHARGRWMGLFSAAIALSTMVSPAIGGWALRELPGNALWYLCGVLGVLLAGTQLLLQGRYTAAVSALEQVPDEPSRATS